MIRQSAVVLGSVLALGCQPALQPAAKGDVLANRAYVVSLESDELTVIDLDRLEIIGRVPTGGVENHMAEPSFDLKKIYVNSSGTHETLVIDALDFKVLKRIPTGRHNTHLSTSRDGRLLAVMAEDEGSGAVSFIDTALDVEVKRLGGFFTPHFMRFAADGMGYVANIHAHHLSRVNLDSLEIEEHIALDGFQPPPAPTLAPEEGGFADAQIDPSGVLYAAHHATGKVLVYDTVKHQKQGEVPVGSGPWVAFAEHPFEGIPPNTLVTNLGDSTVSLLDNKLRGAPKLVATLPGDEEAYGVNFSPRAPEKAFVMNRVRKDVAVVDTVGKEVLTRIDVGGNTETAATTADGKYIVAAVSSADKVVVIDAVSNQVVKEFPNVGRYPWSVTIPRGQNYCH
jgi:YVTN family beta-propeller protein